MNLTGGTTLRNVSKFAIKIVSLNSKWYGRNGTAQATATLPTVPSIRITDFWRFCLATTSHCRVGAACWLISCITCNRNDLALSSVRNETKPRSRRCLASIQNICTKSNASGCAAMMSPGMPDVLPSLCAREYAPPLSTLRENKSARSPSVSHIENVRPTRRSYELPLFLLPRPSMTLVRTLGCRVHLVDPLEY